MIQIRGLSKTYGSGKAAVQALRHVDMDVHAGEVALLMGPSGSGKTTLLSIMGCILTASTGSVRVDGTEIGGLSASRLPEIRRNYFGFVFQGFNLFPALTAQENVEMMLNLKGTSGRRARHRAAELLEQLGLERELRQRPSTLSGGQQQRVAIARALAGDPKVILADEPTGALDTVSGRQVLDILKGLAKDRGCAVVIVSHDTRVLEYCDRLIQIDDGRVQLNHERSEIEVNV